MLICFLETSEKFGAATNGRIETLKGELEQIGNVKEVLLLPTNYRVIGALLYATTSKFPKLFEKERVRNLCWKCEKVKLCGNSKREENRNENQKSIKDTKSKKLKLKFCNISKTKSFG